MRKPADLELGVIPRSTLEKFSKTHEHRMALIRTIATSINVIATMCVLLRVFKVI
jgi:hypothetical protein